MTQPRTSFWVPGFLLLLAVGCSVRDTARGRKADTLPALTEAEAADISGAEPPRVTVAVLGDSITDGGEWAEEGMREELKHYTHIVLIQTLIGDAAALRERAKKNAHFFGKDFEEVLVELDLIERLVHGPHSAPDFVVVPPGERVSQDPFLE